MQKILLLFGVAKGLYGSWLSRKVYNSALAAVGFAIAASIVTSAMILGFCKAMYIVMIYNQVTPAGAFFMMGGIMLFIVLMLIMLCKAQLRKIRRIVEPGAAFKGNDSIGGVIDAFIDGLMNDNKTHR